MAPSSSKPLPATHDMWQSRLLNIAHTLSTLLPTSLFIFIYERALIPLYGAGPTTLLLQKAIIATVALATLHPFNVPTSRFWLSAALCLCMAPNATYWTAVLTSRQKWPVLGPAITHAVALAPLVFTLTSINVDIDLPGSQKTLQGPSRPPLVYRLVKAGIFFVGLTLLREYVWKELSILNNVSESQIFIGLAGVAFGLWILQPSYQLANKNQLRKPTFSLRQTKLASLVALIAVWWSLHPFFASPVLPHPLKETYTHPSEPLQIHSSVQSTTGLVVVGEALPPLDHDGRDDAKMHSVRYLRASHSILGGVWTGSKVHSLDDASPLEDSYGKQLGDSIYSTFVLQEASRLVNSTEQGKTGSWDKALVIGLGTGISTTAFIRHGISTTIVEIDPAVYDASRKFFALPDPGPGNVFLEDARSWVAKKRANIEAEGTEALYDIVIHDCFSGGGVPEHIFTMEFWEDLKSLTKPEAVIVVNFAGILQSDSSKMVIRTVEKNFGQCRAFHDVFGELTAEKYGTDFINMVLFCTQSKAPLTFRKPRYSDYLGSPLRRHVLNSLSTREINLELIRTSPSEDGKYVLTDNHNPLGELQSHQGLEHWAVMREVLPDVHWETY